MRKWIQGFIEKIMPVDRFFIVIFAFVFNSLLYCGARMIAGDWHHYILTSRLDEKIPLIPESVYLFRVLHILGYQLYYYSKTR